MAKKQIIFKLAKNHFIKFMADVMDFNYLKIKVKVIHYQDKNVCYFLNIYQLI